MALKEIDGLPVFDAKRPIKLVITKHDCERGDPKHPESCAAARALRRSGAKDVRVHLGRVYARQNDGNWLRYLTPRALRSEIIAFDRGGSFAPGEYHLLAPQPSHRAKGKRYGGNKPSRKTGKKRRAPHIITDVRMGPA